MLNPKKWPEPTYVWKYQSTPLGYKPQTWATEDVPNAMGKQNSKCTDKPSGKQCNLSGKQCNLSGNKRSLDTLGS